MAVGLTPVTPDKTHLMIPWKGVACGFSKRPPWEWPKGHFQVDAKDIQAVTCAECLAQFKLLPADVTAPPTKASQRGVCYHAYINDNNAGKKCPDLQHCKHGTGSTPYRFCTGEHVENAEFR